MDTSILFQETQLGALKLKNKFVVAPLTRMRANQPDMVPNDLMVEYYSQRASFGLILTECSQISPLSHCFPGSGGIYTQEQANGWKKVVDAVHEKGSLIMLQIWHNGRAVNASQIGGQQPVGPSPIAIDQNNFLANNEPYPVPHELTIEEIKEIVQQYKRGAELAKQAGFDGVELHGANGYLVDQFLRDGSNQRTDIYGGSVQNRSRFCLEVIDALAEVFGYDRVAVRLSPTGRYNGQYDSNPLALMEYLLGELSKRNLAFVELKRHGALEYFIKNNSEDKRIPPAQQIPDFFNQLRKFYQGNLIANDGIKIEEAVTLTSNNTAQAISFGVLSISNPDLPIRVKNNCEINQTIDKNTWFFGESKGYTDFPTYEQQIQINSS
ncbi:hypothetical protein ABPG72_007868 [Tetrahymena utriculariae]